MCTAFRTLGPQALSVVFNVPTQNLPEETTAHVGGIVPVVLATGMHYNALPATFGYSGPYGLQPNARSETWRAVPLWRESTRCIIPARGWIERGHWISSAPQARILPFAGIYSAGHCAILTMNSMPDIVRLHQRQPVVLTMAGIPKWLQHDELELQTRFKIWE